MSKRKAENGDAYYGAFAQHDPNGGGLADPHRHASPGIDSDESNYGTHRSNAGQIDSPLATANPGRGYVSIRTLGGRKRITKVV